MLLKSTLLILSLLCATTIIRTQESTDESSTVIPVDTVQQESVSSIDNSTESEESKESNETVESVIQKAREALLTCGLRNTNGFGLTNDELENTKFGEFPWLVSMAEEIEDDVQSFVCTGAIISPSVVVTTAHCVQQFASNPRSLVLTAGVWNSSVINNDFPTQKRYAKRLVMLEHFEKSFHMNDIAVVVLETPFELMQHIQPICLPMVTESFDDHKCLLNYWNIVNGNINPRTADLTVVSGGQCGVKLLDHKVTNDLPMHESIICAVSERNDGDCDKQLGAPLICPVPGMPERYYLAGIASVGYGCSNDSYVGLFVNVALLRRWIVSMGN